MSQNLFKWKHFESEIILLCVRWYLKYPLSYRMLVEMMRERGLKLTHTTIMRWVHQYSPIINQKLRNQLKPTNDSWRMDEIYIKIKGKNAYLYRAVDSKGFGSLEGAEKTIAGIEIMHMIRKGQVEGIECALSEVELINKIMSIAA